MGDKPKPTAQEASEALGRMDANVRKFLLNKGILDPQEFLELPGWFFMIAWRFSHGLPVQHQVNNNPNLRVWNWAGNDIPFSEQLSQMEVPPAVMLNGEGLAALQADTKDQHSQQSADESAEAFAAEASTPGVQVRQLTPNVRTTIPPNPTPEPIVASASVIEEKESLDEHQQPTAASPSQEVNNCVPRDDRPPAEPRVVYVPQNRGVSSWVAALLAIALMIAVAFIFVLGFNMWGNLHNTNPATGGNVTVLVYVNGNPQQGQQTSTGTTTVDIDGQTKTFTGNSAKFNVNGKTYTVVLAGVGDNSGNGSQNGNGGSNPGDAAGSPTPSYAPPASVVPSSTSPSGDCETVKANTWNDNGSNPPWDMEVQSKDGPSHIDYYTRIDGHNTPAVSFITPQLQDGQETWHWSGFGSMWTYLGSGCNPQMDAGRYVVVDRCAPSNNSSGLVIDLTDPANPVIVANRDNLTADQINLILAPIQDAINNNRSQHPDQPKLNLQFSDGTALLGNDTFGGNPCEGTSGGDVCTIADPGVRPPDVSPDPNHPWAPTDQGWIVQRGWTNSKAAGPDNYPPHGQEIVVLWGPDVASRPKAIIGGARWVFQTECAARQDFEGQTAYQDIHIDLTAGDQLPAQFLP